VESQKGGGSSAVKILVTGVGAIIGYGVLRSLKHSGFHLIGMDIYADAYGQHLSDEFVQAIPTSDAGYPEFLEGVLRTHRPDLVLPCIEQDIARYDLLRDLFARHNVACCLNRSELIKLCADKWHFYEAAVAQNLDAIETSLSNDFDQLSAEFALPFLLKPRRSYASKGIVEITSADVFALYKDRIGDYFMAQKQVGRPEEEYTVGVFGDGAGGFSAQIQLRRTLSREGATQKAWVVNDGGLTAAVTSYCSAFQPLGPTNLQFRRADDRWRLLEINPRISSSASLRAAFGYNEASQAIGYYLDGILPSQPAIRSGSAIRYIEDHVQFDDRPDL
jgi:carbamoyl-phosphate synthase large subunit